LTYEESQIRNQDSQKVHPHPLFGWIEWIFDGLVEIKGIAEAQSHVGHVKHLIQKLLCNVEDSITVVVHHVKIFE